MDVADPQTTVAHIEVPELSLLAAGKVRHNYALGDYLLMVTSDRLSAFDVVFAEPIPGKGAALTRLSRFWFEYLAPFAPHHLVSADVDGILAYARHVGVDLERYREMLAGRSLLVKRLRMLPVECVARGYLAGSGWREYRERGTVCGIALPPGLSQGDRVPEPLFTPATKAEQGAHDENIPYERVVEILGAALAAKLRETTLALYREAAELALSRGILIADTKFEFGLDEHDTLTLADEVLTPDSSRFWPVETYAAGQSPPSFDKQFVRDHLEGAGFTGQGDAPPLPAEIIAKTAERYATAVTRLMSRTS